MKKFEIRKSSSSKSTIILSIIFIISFIMLILSIINIYHNNPLMFSISDNTLKYILIGIILLILLFGIMFTISIYLPIYKVSQKHIEDVVDFRFLDKKKEPIKQISYKYFNDKDNNNYVYIESLNSKENTPKPDNGSRFFSLTHIDNLMKSYVEPNFDNKISLKELCEDFRNYSAYKLHLYYDIKDIRRFISSLGVTKLILLQGMSGTGKTSLAYAFGEYLNNKTVVVPIQPMWKERTDLIGYYNEFTKKFNETTLLNKMYEANYTKDIYITVLDEMNIARVEYYFAEFLSLLELPNPEGRNLDVVSDVWENDPKLLHDGKLRLPINMWFIGTANNDDSTFAVSDKVYDRAMVLNLDKKALSFEGKPTKEDKISVNHLYELFTRAKLKNKLSQRNLRRLEELDKYLIETFSLTFGNRIMKQISDYVPIMVEAGGTEIDALDDIISRKILRKLEAKNPVYVRSQSEALINKLNDLFGENKLENCIEQIRHLEQN